MPSPLLPRLPPPITSRSNAKVKALRRAFNGTAAQPGELAGIEGHISVREALAAGLRFDTLLAKSSVAAGLPSDWIAQLAPREFLVLADEVFDSVVDTVSPQELAATVVIPAHAGPGPSSGLFLLLEEIQDPGNLGTLIRSAEAFGVERLFLSPGCANPWSPKVIRASAGSVFRQPMAKVPFATAMCDLRRQGVRVAGAVVQEEGATISLAAELAPPIALVIGNEGSGLSRGALSSVDQRVYIPCLTESLNAAVAGSLLLYEAQRQALSRPPKRADKAEQAAEAEQAAGDAAQAKEREERGRAE